jgi:hypothetical protein
MLRYFGYIFAEPFAIQRVYGNTGAKSHKPRL